MGETCADYVDKRYNPLYAVAIAGLVLLAALCAQLIYSRYEEIRYWFAVVMVSVFGTQLADALHVKAGIPYQVTSPLFALLLALTFWQWKKREGTLSIHSITSTPRELFYWATVMLTFALGTAVGDLTAVVFHWGYFSSGLVFAGAFILPALGFRFFKLNAIFAFWSSYILTRPFGASFADWMGVNKVRGGLNWGTGPVTLALTGIIVVLVLVLKWESRASKSK